jgi:NhaP-type Na+/H+ or K+/H+ antiporter
LFLLFLSYSLGIGAFIVCILFAYCSQTLLSHWPLENLFLFASILCATDPVSVVALLKSSKASSKLTMTIAGESILNDGAAMILYIFFFNMLNGTVYTAGTFLVFMSEMLILSPLLGMGFGAITAYLMRIVKRPHNDFLDIQCLLTITCSYLSFFIAGYLCQVSGVLACAVAGVTVSYFGPIAILEHEDFHHTWEKVEWCCNTLIFLYAGFIGGGKVASVISIHHIFYLIILYIFLFITRAAMITICVPILRLFGFQYSWSEAVFMTYAGLRGALGIALALEGAHNAIERHDQIFGEELFFFVTGLASFTLLINSSTAKMMLLKLQLIPDRNQPISTDLQEVRFILRDYMSMRLRQEMHEVEETHQEVVMKEGEREEEKEEVLEIMHNIQEHIGLFRKIDHEKLRVLCCYYSFDKEVEANTFDHHPKRKNANGKDKNDHHHPHHQKKKDIADIDKNQQKVQENMDHNIHHLEGVNATFAKESRLSKVVISKDLQTFIRSTFLEIVRARYRYAIKHDHMGLGSSAAKLLLHSLDLAQDNVELYLSDWDHVLQALQPVSLISRFCQSLDWLLYTITKDPHAQHVFLNSYEGYCERVAMFTVTNFVDAHYHAQKQISTILGKDYHDGSKTQDTILNHVHIAQSKVCRESQQQIAKAIKVLKAFPEKSLVDWYTHRAAKIIIHKQFQLLHDLAEQGILTEIEFTSIEDALKADELRIKRSSTKSSE